MNLLIVEEFVNRLEGVTGHDGQYSARCPAHDDKNASLSVGKGDNGKILIHCHAGCSCAAILSAMGLAESDLFDDNRKFSRERKRDAGKSWRDTTIPIRRAVY